MQSSSKFFPCFSKEQKKLKIPILILKSDITKEFITSIIPDPFFPIVTATNLEANSLFRKTPFLIVIADIGQMKDFSDDYKPLLYEIRLKNKSTFIIVFSELACSSPILRQECFNQGANMVSNCFISVQAVLKLIYLLVTLPGKYLCPICTLPNMTEDSLWYHLPLYHVNEQNVLIKCPICQIPSKPNLQIHIRNFHGPCARKEVPIDFHVDMILHAFSLVVVHRKKDNKFLLVQEFANSGYWLPGGSVNPKEDLLLAGIRETKEEAGIDIEITGVLTVQYHSSKSVRLRVIFYGVPIDENQKPKSIPDYESAGASYVKFEEIEKIPLRGIDPAIWIGYVLDGGQIFPTSIFSSENENKLKKSKTIPSEKK